MNDFAAVAEVDVANRNPKLPDNFVGGVEILSCHLIQTRKFGKAYIAEFEITESNLPEVIPGQKYAWFQSIVPDGPGYANLFKFAVAVMGYDRSLQATEIKEKLQPHLPKILDESCLKSDGTGNKFAGRRLKITTQKAVSKQNREFTKYDFFKA